MDSILIYLSESGICLAAFYIMYKLLLRNDTFFSVNRAYLLLTAPTALIIPLLDFSPAYSSEIYYMATIEDISAGISKLEHNAGLNLSGEDYALIFFGLGSVLMIWRFSLQLIRLSALRKGSEISIHDGYRLAITERDIPPFSFMNTIYISSQLAGKKESEQILAHEKVHIKRKHSLDIILLELITLVQWCNPFIWLYKNSIKEIHEFQADEGVLQSGYDSAEYHKTIVGQAAGFELFAVSNSFNYTSIKRRLRMLTRSRTKKSAMFKLLIILPVSAMLFFSFSCSGKKDAESTGYDFISVAHDSTASFKGGWAAERDFTNEHLKMPAEFIDRGIPGKLTIRFDVNEDGSISNAKVAQSIELGGKWKEGPLGYGCDEAALSFINNMPDWNPAIKNGKPIKTTVSKIILFGDEKMKREWNEYHRAQDNWIESRGGGAFEEVSFKGGFSELRKFVAEKLEYPSEAKNKGIEGTVETAFTVGKDGSVSNIKIVQSIGYGCDEEAKRVLSLMPKWENKTGKNVEMKLPIKFSLNGNNDNTTAKVRYKSEDKSKFIEIDEMPKLDNDAFVKNLKYPENARKEGIEGSVILKALINKDGKAEKVEILETDNKIFNQSAIDAIKKTAFKPGRDKGKNVSAWVTVPVRYKLK